MRKTVAVLTSEPLTALGGVEHVVREIEEGLALRGYEVRVLHRENSAPAWIKHAKSFPAKYLSDFLLSWYVGEKLRQFKDSRLVAVISNGAIGWHIPHLDGQSTKAVHIYHGTYRQQAEAIRPFIKHRGYLKLKWWDSMVLERASGKRKLILCNSDQTLDEVHRYFGFAGTTTWLPLDTQHFRPLDQSDCRGELGLAKLGPLGIFVGSTHPMKGFPVVQTCMRLLPEVRWILALRGSIPVSLRHDSRVSLFENACEELLPTLYSAADFAIFPSRYEPFGYVVAEALSCGTPVIASPGGASRLFLREPPLSSLLMTDAINAERYARAVQDVLRDTPRYRQAVLQMARPRVVQTMARENWWENFLAATGL
jgi:glycosyltransferase involved in cell wall biosynthesis